MLLGKKFNKFIEDSDRSVSIILCGKCGSSRVELTSDENIQCLNCGNRIAIEPYAFRVAKSAKNREAAFVLKNDSVFMSDVLHSLSDD